MSDVADRRARGRRNVLADRLALGAPAPLVDLPVSVLVGTVGAGEAIVPQATVPVMIPYGGAATILVEDSEPDVVYRLRVAGEDVRPGPVLAEAKGDGGPVLLAVPRIEATTTFAVDARTPHGRMGTLRATGAVEIGLDRGIAVALLDDATAPVILDYGASVAVRLVRSQEAVSYGLVLQPPGTDREDAEAAIVSACIAGKGDAIILMSGPLATDGVLRVRAERALGRGKTQAVLLDLGIAVHVRADPARPVTLAPAVSDHAGMPTVTVDGAQRGVRYALAIDPLADAAFLHGAPSDTDTLVIDADGECVRVKVPPSASTEIVPADRTVSAVGADDDLAMVMPPLTADSAVIVHAIKMHGVGAAAFETAVRLTMPVVALVRPDPAPRLRIEAAVEGAMLRGIALGGGEPGVFYALIAGRERLGELYMHQRDPDDPERNKGVGAIGIGIDLVVAADFAVAAPPPIARLDCARKLPVKLRLEARRATTGLATPLAAAVTIDATPRSSVAAADDPAEGFAITLDALPVGAVALIAVDGTPLGAAVTGVDGSRTLVTGPLRPGAKVDLLVQQGEEDGIVVTRRIAVPTAGR